MESAGHGAGHARYCGLSASLAEPHYGGLADTPQG
jgi:hypothetical protein